MATTPVPYPILSAAEAALLNPTDDTAQRAVENAWRDAAADALAAHIRRAVDAFPPLSPEQRGELAAILRTGRTPSDLPEAS